MVGHSVAGLTIAEQGPVAVITIDNPAEQNRLTRQALQALAASAATLQGRRDVNVVLIRGSGVDYFSSGILNPVLRVAMSKDEVIELVMEAAATFDTIEALPQLVVAGVNGHVRAGGVELALACDIRVVARHARMSLPEARWGGFPGAGGPLRLSRLLGRARALELITRGFAAVGEPHVAVCLLPGTEIVFDANVEVEPSFGIGILPNKKTFQRLARFRQINMDNPVTHHDALEFPDGQVVLLTRLCEGQRATVLQLPAASRTLEEAREQKRVPVVA